MDPHKKDTHKSEIKKIHSKVAEIKTKLPKTLERIAHVKPAEKKEEVKPVVEKLPIQKQASNVKVEVLKKVDDKDGEKWAWQKVDLEGASAASQKQQPEVSKKQEPAPAAAK